jgi:hypothetical protein
MKYNIVSAVLLLLIVTDFSSGRAIQKRGLHEREVDLLDIDKKGLTPLHLYDLTITSILGRDNGGITVYGQLDDIKSLRKRVNLIEGTPLEGEDADEGADGGEGSSTSNPKSVKSYLPRGM